MADHAVAGHLRVGHFSQQLRFEPVHALGVSALGWLAELRPGHFQWRQALVEMAEGGAVESCAYFASVAQLTAVRVMQGQQQGAEGFARTFGIGEADNHELLALLALELDPVTAAAA
ncbi:hypothetical protein D3C77_542450 [compost metagenome]